MNTANASPNVATYALVIMGFVVLMSLWTLLRYFLSERTPLELNARSRYEAGLPPLEVLNEHRRSRRQKLVVFTVLVILFYGWLDSAAHDQTQAAVSAFGNAVAITFGEARDGLAAVLDQLGVGNECECSDPSRIGGNRP